MYKKLFSKLPPDQLPKTSTEAFERVCKKKNIAVFGEYKVLEVSTRKFIRQDNCQILVMEIPIGTVSMSLVVPKDNPYRNLFNFQ